MKDKGNGAQHILHRLWLTITTGDLVNLKAVVTSLATLVLALLFRGLVRRFRLPQFDMLAVLIFVSVVVYFAGWTVAGVDGETAIGVAGIVPAGLPSPHIPIVNLRTAQQLFPDSVTIALLGPLAALAIAKSIANQTRQQLDCNRQCLAEGIANPAGGFFQCLPGSGSLSRSAINFQVGAASRVSGALTAAFVAVAILLLAPLARYVPKPALAALPLLTAARLIDLKRVAFTFRAFRMDAGVLAVAAASAIAFGLDQAILIGVALSILLFVPRAAKLKVGELTVDSGDVVRGRLRSETQGADLGPEIGPRPSDLRRDPLDEIAQDLLRIQPLARPTGYTFSTGSSGRTTKARPRRRQEQIQNLRPGDAVAFHQACDDGVGEHLLKRQFAIDERTPLGFETRLEQHGLHQHLLGNIPQSALTMIFGVGPHNRGLFAANMSAVEHLPGPKGEPFCPAQLQYRAQPLRRLRSQSRHGTHCGRPELMQT